MAPSKRGRPAGPETVSLTARIYVEQKQRLDYLSERLDGNPAIIGLIRQAIEQYLDRKFDELNLREDYKRVRLTLMS